MLFSLAFKNIKKSLKDYSIYFFTLVVSVAIFYIFNSMDAQSAMLSLTESKASIIEALVSILSYVSIFVSIILGFLIIYSNNFLIKRRKKEIGLYLTLGMSKSKVSLILVIETFIVGIVSLAVGLVLGVVLSQGLSIVVAHIFEAPMDKFKFVFSNAAFIKTMTYYGIIFILVMIFNVISLSHYKLIDLLSAGRKNESVKFRNKYITIIAFILAIALIGYAYHLLFNNAILLLGKDTIRMLVCGSLGTLLLFYSLSGFTLFVVSKIKPLYYRNLNMFNLKQINSKINTSVISTTVITLMLLLTICILSTSISLASAFNNNIEKFNPIDFTIWDSSVYNYSTEIVGVGNVSSFDLNAISKEETFNKYVKNYLIYKDYKIDTLPYSYLLTEKENTQLNKDYNGMVELDSPIELMSYSDYKAINDYLGRTTEPMEDNEYILTADAEIVFKYFSDFYDNNNTISLDGNVYKPATNKILDFSYQNSNTACNQGLLILPDKALENYKPNYILMGNYKEATEETNKAFNAYLDTITLGDDETSIYPLSYNIMDKISIAESSTGLSAIVTFIGLYLGLIFAISSVTVLAIGELSDSSDNRDRYKVLKQIGADNKMINKALFTQIFITFMLPLVVALIHSFFGIKELNHLIKTVVNVDITKSICITTVFMIAVYGGYFLVTYIASKRIIKE